MANHSDKHIQKIIFIIPLVLAVIQVIQNYLDSPAFYSRIDPEYLCLLNGLNVSIFKFDHIGYVDLPGTPFILLTGIFIRITHMLLGDGQIYTDVISRPELYLHAASFQLMLLTTWILVWGGKKILKDKKDLLGVIILQSTFFLSGVCLHLPTRYMADRVLPVYVFLFAIFTILFFRNELSEKKYALVSGLILGIGLITKLNFLPVLIIPLFLICSHKYKFTYLGSLLVSSFFSFLPIISKFSYVKKFFLSIIMHDGLYGAGNKQIFNFSNFTENLIHIKELNFSFTLIIVLSILTIIYLLKHPKAQRQSLFFLIAFLIATLIEAIMVSKHFKDYYLAPILALSGIVLFVIWEVANRNNSIRRSLKLLLGIFILTLLIVPNLKVARHSIDTLERNKERQLSVEFLHENRKPTDWLFLEPSWKSDPTVENGLIWGISYVAERNDYLKYFEEVYPRVVAYEGVDKPISQFRCGDADEKEIMESKDDILLMAIPGDQTPQMIDKLNRLASQYGQSLQYDTIFVNARNKDMIIKAFHLD